MAWINPYDAYAQQEALVQYQNQVNNYQNQLNQWHYTTTNTTTAITNGGTIKFTVAASEEPKKPAPDTNLAWLDRRVEEMRVHL